MISTSFYLAAKNYYGPRTLTEFLQAEILVVSYSTAMLHFLTI